MLETWPQAKCLIGHKEFTKMLLNILNFVVSVCLSVSAFITRERQVLVKSPIAYQFYDVRA